MDTPLSDHAPASAPAKTLTRQRALRLPALLAGRFWRNAGPFLALLALGLGLWTYYQRTSLPVILVLDGQPLLFRTHQSSVGGFLQEVGLALAPADVVVPPADSPLAGGHVLVQRARLFLIEVDGELRQIYSHAATINDLLQEAGLQVGPRDQVLVEGQPAGFSAPLSGIGRPTGQASLSDILTPARSGPSERPAPLRLALRRAIPLYIHDGAVDGELYTTATTVGQALLDQGIVLYLGDRVNPSLGTRLSAGLHVYIKRSMPAEILADGRRILTRTQVRTVGELLSQAGISLLGQDRVEPAETTPLQENTVIKVTRVREELNIEEEPIAFETVWVPDPNLELDSQQLTQAGEEGLTKRRLRLRYEDGKQVSKIIEDEWVDRQPVTKTIAYGTKIVLRELVTPEGTLQYWRHIRMFATSYTAATCGKDRSDPTYGITRLGWQMRHGIVAIDPTVISFLTEMWVPGYGRGIAADTGGMILGKHIDLGYDEWEAGTASWARWVDVYLLAPVPSPDKIRYVLPAYPREPR
jgi:uncharacterized protein YabE (DUF348 family)